MIRPSRILDSRLLPFALAAPAHGVLAYTAWQGSQFSLGALIVALYLWSTLALFSSIHWGSSIQGWTRSLDGWKDANDQARDVTMLLAEALDELSIYDAERVVDIAERYHTIGALRIANIKERETDD